MASSDTARDPKVLVYGSGAVGGFLGAMLTDRGLPVTLLCRASQADELRRGVTIVGSKPESRTVAHTAVVTTVDQLPDIPDIVLVCTKAYDIESAMPDLRRLARTGTLLVTLQNGIGSEDRLLADISSPRLSLAAGALTVSLDRRTDGTIQRATSQGGLALALVQTQITGSDRLAWLATTFASVGLPCQVLDQWQPMKWSKLLLNLLGNATSAILAMSPSAIYRDSRLFTVERAEFFEALATMLGSGWFPIGLPGFNLPLLSQLMRLPPALSRRLLVGRVGGGRGNKQPSLWIDVERGQVPTEVGWLNGAVARQAEGLGIPAPVNHRLAELVDQLVAGEVDRDRFAGKPEALLSELGM